MTSFSSFSSSYNYSSNPFEENEMIQKSQNINGKSEFEIHKKIKTPKTSSQLQSAHLFASSEDNKSSGWNVTTHRNTTLHDFPNHHTHVNTKDELQTLWNTISSHLKDSKFKKPIKPTTKKLSKKSPTTKKSTPHKSLQKPKYVRTDVKKTKKT